MRNVRGGRSMATVLVAAPPVTRRAWIDKLRVAVIAGVIAFHAATAYVVAVPWYYQERTTSAATQIAFGVPTLLAAIFGLGPLFVVAGWLSSVSLATTAAGGSSSPGCCGSGCRCWCSCCSSTRPPTTWVRGPRASGWA
jgi:hypothetical protein